MARPQHRQAELDRYASRRGWSPAPFKSWRVHGFTVAVGASGDPAKAYVASRGAERKDFADLGALERWVSYLAVTGSEPG